MKIDLKKYIRTVPNFPIQGIQFRDITSLIETPIAFNESLNLLQDTAIGFECTKIVGIESRGFVFGAPIARELNIPFVLARKPGKLPNESYKRDFDLEYGSTSLEIQKVTDLTLNDKVVIVDDLIATGGTAIACANLINEEFNVPKENIIILAIIDLPDLKGSKLINENGYQVHTIIKFEGD
jgi:adenine phosphoribosyltransferase